MSDSNNIKVYTAADIEKYHKGQLSATERHELEKAALDDPFLADALEGYSIPGINIPEDLAELKQRLTEKTEKARVIPIHTPIERSKFPWLRVAIAVILIAGAGVLAYEFLYKSSIGSHQQVAVAQPEKQRAAGANEKGGLVKDSGSGSLQRDDVGDDDKSRVDTQHQFSGFEANGKEMAKAKTDPTVSTGSRLDTSTISSYNFSTSNAPTISPSANNELPATNDAKRPSLEYESNKAADIAKKGEIRDMGFRDSIALARSLPRQDSLKDGNNYGRAKAADGFWGNVAAQKGDIAYRKPNYFRGRVTDNFNNPLPFANITNTKDNVGTYSDAQGYFTLVSPDSVMSVQVRSVGFDNNNIQLRSNAGDVRVLMQEDKSVAVDTVDKVKRNISSRRKNTLVLEEPEPEDGWDSYGSYVANNLNVPDNFEKKKTAGIDENSVEVSFEVTRDGNPVNFKVEKSLCDQCDKEAIRLIKEGPKWKRKTKKSKRTTISVPFR